MNRQGQTAEGSAPTTPRLLDQVRSLMCLQHYSIHTERKVISLMEGDPQLIVQMLYGSGLRAL